MSAARERGELAGAPKKRGPARRVVDPRDTMLAEELVMRQESYNVREFRRNRHGPDCTLGLWRRMLGRRAEQRPLALGEQFPQERQLLHRRGAVPAAELREFREEGVDLAATGCAAASRRGARWMWR
jgi:hypothetical protein